MSVSSSSRSAPAVTLGCRGAAACSAAAVASRMSWTFQHTSSGSFCTHVIDLDDHASPLASTHSSRRHPRHDMLSSRCQVETHRLAPTGTQQTEPASYRTMMFWCAMKVFDNVSQCNYRTRISSSGSPASSSSAKFSTALMIVSIASAYSACSMHPVSRVSSAARAAAVIAPRPCGACLPADLARGGGADAACTA